MKTILLNLAISAAVGFAVAASFAGIAHAVPSAEQITSYNEAGTAILFAIFAPFVAVILMIPFIYMRER